MLKILVNFTSVSSVTMEKESQVEHIALWDTVFPCSGLCCMLHILINVVSHSVSQLCTVYILYVQKQYICMVF